MVKLKKEKKSFSCQLSKVKTLYKAHLDEGLEIELRTRGCGHLLDDEPESETLLHPSYVK